MKRGTLLSVLNFLSFIFLLVFLCFCIPAFSQEKSGREGFEFLDSIQASFKKRPRFTGGLSTTNTFINGFRSPILTVRAGLEFNNLVKVGAGISWLKLSKYDEGKDNTPFYQDKTLVDIAGMHTVHPALQVRYLNLFLDYVYYRTKKWQFSIPVQCGIGDSRYKYKFNGKKVVENRHLILFYEPAVSGQYKITPWFGVGLDVGYRLMLISNKNIGSKFNSPVYNLKTIIFWEELYDMFFADTKLGKKLKIH